MRQEGAGGCSNPIQAEENFLFLCKKYSVFRQTCIKILAKSAAPPPLHQEEVVLYGYVKFSNKYWSNYTVYAWLYKIWLEQMQNMCMAVSNNFGFLQSEMPSTHSVTSVNSATVRKVFPQEVERFQEYMAVLNIVENRDELFFLEFLALVLHFVFVNVSVSFFKNKVNFSVLLRNLT